MTSQLTSGTRSLTHGQTLPMLLEWPYNKRYSLRTWLRKNTVIFLKHHRGRWKVRVDAEEWYLNYVLLQHSGRQHVKLKSDIHNDYTTGDGRYPKTNHNTLHILTQYTKPIMTRNYESKENSFSQKNGNRRNTQTYDKTYWKDKECYNFHQKSHPSSHCPNNKNKRTMGTTSPSPVKKLNQY